MKSKNDSVVSNDYIIGTEGTDSFKNGLEKLLESNIILTVFTTGLGYGIAYVYQMGQFLKYGLPYYFIEITTTALVASIGLTLATGLLVSAYTAMYYDFEKRNSVKKWVKYFIRTIIILLIVALVMVVLDILYWRLIVFFILVVAATATIVGIIYSIIHKSLKKGFSRLFKSPSSNKLIKRESVVDNLPQRLGLFIATGISSLLLAFFCGSLFASPKGQYAQYAILEKNNNIYEVVVLSRGDYVYTKKFDSESKKFSKGFEKKKLPENKTIDYGSIVEKEDDPITDFLLDR